jgi:hypothetical protein
VGEVPSGREDSRIDMNATEVDENRSGGTYGWSWWCIGSNIIGGRHLILKNESET